MWLKLFFHFPGLIPNTKNGDFLYNRDEIHYFGQLYLGSLVIQFSLSKILGKFTFRSITESF